MLGILPCMGAYLRLLNRFIRHDAFVALFWMLIVPGAVLGTCYWYSQAPEIPLGRSTRMWLEFFGSVLAIIFVALGVILLAYTSLAIISYCSENTATSHDQPSSVGAGSGVGFIVLAILLFGGSKNDDKPKQTQSPWYTKSTAGYSSWDGKPSDMLQSQYDYAVARYEAEGFSKAEAQKAAQATWDFMKQEEYRKQHVYPNR